MDYAIAKCALHFKGMRVLAHVKGTWFTPLRSAYLRRQLLCLVLLCSVSVPLFSGIASSSFSGLNSPSFIPNKGQIYNDNGTVCTEVAYYARLRGMDFFARPRGFSYVLRVQQPVSTNNDAPHSMHHEADPIVDLHRIDVDFVNASALVQLQPDKLQPQEYHFYTRRDVALSHLNAYASLRYSNIYPGIDAVIDLSRALPKIEFIVHAGADPSQIQLRYSGDTKLSLMPDGSLQLYSPLATLSESAPLSYQRNSDERQIPISSSFVCDGNHIRFELADYDTSRELIIDPEVQWSTYFGGAGDDIGVHVTMDNSRNVLVMGRTLSPLFPVRNGLQNGLKGSFDAWTASFNDRGALQWSTYFGGSKTEISDVNHCDLTTDSKNNVIITGCTQSSDVFLTNGAFQSNKSVGFDTFIAKFRSDGTIMWSTYCGGSDNDDVYGICTDATDRIYITGNTASTNFPRADDPDEFQVLNKKTGIWEDAYVFCLSAAGRPIRMVYFGGGDAEYSNAIVSDALGNVVIVGYTRSTDLPVTSGCFQAQNKSGLDAFVARFFADGKLNWASYYGGNSGDAFNSVALDSASASAQSIIIAGYTRSSDIPKNTTLKDSLSGFQDALLLNFSVDGAFRWARYHGGTNTESANGVTIDPDNNILLVGTTGSNDYPQNGGFQPKYGGKGDCFIAKFRTDGVYQWGTFFGGLGDDAGMDIAVDGITNFVVTGYTSSQNFPVQDAHQAQHADNGSSNDAFLARLCNIAIPTMQTQGSVEYCKGGSASMKAVNLNSSVRYDSYQWVMNGVNIPGATTEQYIVPSTLDSGVYKFTCHVTNTLKCPANTDTITVNVYESPTIITGNYIICRTETIPLDSVRILGTGNYSFAWDNAQYLSAANVQHPIASPPQTTTFTLTVTDNHGCSRQQSVRVTVIDRPEPTISASGALSFCQGDSVILDAGTLFPRYQWSTGESTRRITVKQSGDYTVTAFTLGGCNGISRPITVTAYAPPQPVIRFSANLLVIQQSAEQYTRYQWIENGNDIPGATAAAYRLTKPGIYSVRVVDSHGCTGTSAPFDATILARADISVENTTASPGTRVAIPLLLNRSERMDFMNARQYIAQLSFNATVLRFASAPDALSTKVISRTNNRTTIEVQANRTVSEGTLLNLYFDVALGNEEQSAVTLDSMSWDAPVELSTANGTFTLGGVCKKNGTRLFIDDGKLQLHTISPNPLHNEGELIFSLIEEGETLIEIMNMQGELVQTLLQNTLQPGEYSVHIDAAHLEQGVYFCRLRTPSQSRVTSFVLLR